MSYSITLKLVSLPAIAGELPDPKLMPGAYREAWALVICPSACRKFLQSRFEIFKRNCYSLHR